MKLNGSFVKGSVTYDTIQLFALIKLYSKFGEKMHLITTVSTGGCKQILEALLVSFAAFGQQ